MLDKPSLESFDELYHYGRGHEDGGHSGRYPWGSGDNPYQHDAADFLARVDQMRKDKITYYDNKEFLENGKPNPDYGKTFKGDKAISKVMEISLKEFNNLHSIYYGEVKTAEYNRIVDMKENQHMGATAIAKELGYPNESSVRSALNSSVVFRNQKCKATAELIKGRVDAVGMVQVGSGTEKEIGVTRNMFDTALTMLKQQGYEIYSGRVPQATDPSGAKQTTYKVIGPPGTKHKDIYKYSDINSLVDYISKDGGQTFKKNVFQYPASMDSSRLAIVYGDQGGKSKEGLIEIRRGVEDLSLGEDAYAQVRILVDNDRYLKGMAIYSDDLPDGVDVRFNTKKPSGTAMRDVLKKIKTEKDGTPSENPFGSAVKEKGGQYTFIDKKGNEKLGLINKTRGEGDWEEWSNKVPSQFLSKQPYKLVNSQLKLTSDLKRDELNDILKIENPTVKKNLLDSFAEDCDSTAVHLKAASLPRQKYQVILPIDGIKDNEVFAPNYKNGEKVALIRYPHAGTFEIPILTVNNNQKDARRILGNSVKDCVAINSRVAETLSGADFDGDTVMVIPSNDKITIKNRPRLKELEGFDMELEYGCDPSKTYTDSNGVEHYFNAAGKEFQPLVNTQMEMGKISNLITDMQIKGAPDSDVAKAVKHSMVIVDAVKHHYDYRSSYKENEIRRLKKEYQKKVDPETGRVSSGGASTLISLAKSPTSVDKRKGSPKTNIKGTSWYDPTKPEGALIYNVADDLEYLALKSPVTKKDETVFERDGKYYYNESGDKKNKQYVEVPEDKIKDIRVKTRTTDSNRMSDTDDAYTLISEVNSPIEKAYANFANSMKALANEARVISYNTKSIPYNASAAEAYKTQVDELDSELLKAEKNAPREKQAQLIANARIQAILAENDDIDKEEEGKIRQRETTKARHEVGAERYTINITDDQWNAIQSGAISPTKLQRILDHTDADAIKERATPRGNGKLPSSKVSMIRNMSNNGYTAAQISEYLGVSVSTVHEYLKN